MARGLIAIFVALVFSAAMPGSGAVPGVAMAQDAQPNAKKAKGLKGSIGYRRGYSYSKADVLGSESRRSIIDPSYNRQTTSGPFDNGFFFDSAIGRNGGEAPYMQ